METCTFCPNCRNKNVKSDVFRLLNMNENSKLTAIKNIVLDMKQPLLIFAQWKKVLKSLKVILTDSQLPVMILEGNMSQRNFILKEFKKNGGILLLCISDSFAGIRLENVKYIIFSHALIGNYNTVKSMEIQAIGRALNDNSEINVMSFVTADTREEMIWRKMHPTQLS